ncbi:efflux transporter outer membrane subunit [Vibrio breoganii]|uniref:Efflux transporter outer membrane subunit n=1 Tax=Vibrio breoganii TaxID=553239 RepID=A0AAP8SXG9_9VIBR|nr:efflux transporter outer membrane subunit [Vibrio breoganii]OCH75958.1 hypothetical protein A6D95_10430 [Vibrio breoganii]PMG90928.1 hypothetical protein BCU80_13600 [Vibrio breoganii]PMG92213.1 hypothetical protein BCU79_16045 [Vibrio breoganii]PMK51920.1 hypothetical protein BCT98_15970 [Vibrio breoganii]PMK75844.1 hypothetical protein BCT94_08565 [Vibrio breoganii]
MNLIKKLTPISLALLIAGCAVGPDYEEPETTLAQTYLYAGNEESVNSEYWWKQFNDPTLNQMIVDVQQQNIPLQLAAERIKMANSYKKAVESFKVPTVSIGGGYYNYQLSSNSSLLGPALNPIDTSDGGTVTLLDNQHDGVFIGGSINWELDLFGRIDRQANAASIRAEQAEIFQVGLTTLITADLVHNYVQYLGAKERKKLAMENIEDQRKTLILVEKIVKSGYGSDMDYAQAKAMLAATESVIPQLEIAEQVHKHRLAILLGEPLTQVDVRLTNDSGLPELSALIPVGLPSDLIKRRPDIRMAEREMAAVNEELAASVANRYPKFFLTGTPGVSASSFDELFSSDSFGWMGAVGVNWNVFDGGRGKAMVELNEARFKSAALSYQYTVDSAFAEVDSALFAYGRSQQNQTQLSEAVEATDKAVSKAKSLYKAGLIDHLSVLDAQRQQRVIQDRQVAAKLQSANSTIAVYKALGGDWSTSPQA